MKKNIENVLMALFVACFVIAALGIIFAMKTMTSVALVIITLTTGCYAGVQIFGFLSSKTVLDGADVKVNRQLLIAVIVSTVVFLALLSLTIFQLCGKIF